MLFIAELELEVKKLTLLATLACTVGSNFGGSDAIAKMWRKAHNLPLEPEDKPNIYLFFIELVNLFNN